MFDDIVSRLLEGEFICEVSDPHGFSFLASTATRNGMTNADDVNQYLGRLKRKLSTTNSGTAYFSSRTDIDDRGKRAAKALFAEMKNNLRLLVDFFKLVMDYTGNDYAVRPGQIVDLNQMVAKISENQSLVEALRKVAIQCKGVGGDTDRVRAEKVIKKLRADGYLVETNKEADIYQFTGKIEFFHDVIDFLIQHDNIAEEDEHFNDKRDT